MKVFNLAELTKEAIDKHYPACVGWKGVRLKDESGKEKGCSHACQLTEHPDQWLT